MMGGLDMESVWKESHFRAQAGHSGQRPKPGGDVRRRAKTRCSVRWCTMFAVSLILTAGCITKEANLFKNRRDRNFYKSVADRVDYPENELACQTDFEMVERPHTIRHNATPTDYLNLSLSQAVEYAMENSEVLRDLGGTILRSPEIVRTGFPGPDQWARAAW